MKVRRIWMIAEPGLGGGSCREIGGKAAPRCLGRREDWEPRSWAGGKMAAVGGEGWFVGLTVLGS